MQTRANLQLAAAPVGWTFGHVRDQAKLLGARIVAFIEARPDAYAAAALYEQLSKLSDAELGRHLPFR